MKNFGSGLFKEITGTRVREFDKASDEEDMRVFSHVVRCKGEIWLSNADSCPIGVHSVGRQLVMTPGGNGVSKPWMGKVHEVYPFGDQNSALSREEDREIWSMFDLTNNVIEELRASNGWTDRFGDRGSELVFIGIRLDKKLIVKELHNALLTDAELDAPDRKKAWASDLADYFFDGMPLWELEDILGEEDSEDICDAEEDEE
jgi:G3E family GTPase